jgi:hypothetical protein
MGLSSAGIKQLWVFMLSAPHCLELKKILMTAFSRRGGESMKLITYSL